MRAVSAELARRSSIVLYFLSTYSLVCDDRTVLNITMSFGYSVGDCIAIYQLANQIRERFANAPYQFKAISNE